MIRQAFWAMEQVRKNEQNKLSRGLRRYFKRSKHLLRKPMEALSSEEQERLALMVEIAPGLADAYRLKNEFLAVMHSESSTVGKQRLLDWLAAVNVIVFFASTPTIDIEPEITEISPLRTFLGDFLISVHSITAVSLAIMIIEKSKEVWLLRQKYYLALIAEEWRLMIEPLNNLRNRLVSEGRYTDAVDEVLIKVANAKTKRFKITEWRT